MIKLYRRSDGVLHYHEAWMDEDRVIEHWGAVGERGETREHPAPVEDEYAALEAVLRPAREAGFEPVGEEAHARLVIACAPEGEWSVRDAESRDALQDRLDDTLGWTGLGHCEDGDFASTRVVCIVVDAEIARRVVRADLAGTEFEERARMEPAE